MIGAKAGRDTLQAHEAANQQSRADQQHQRECQFGDHQQAAQTVARGAEAAVALRIAAARFERGVEVHVDGAEGGRQSKDQACQQRDAEGKGEDAAVDSDSLEARDVSGIYGADHVQAPLRR